MDDDLSLAKRLKDVFQHLKWHADVVGHLTSAGDASDRQPLDNQTFNKRNR